MDHVKASRDGELELYTKDVMMFVVISQINQGIFFFCLLDCIVLLSLNVSTDDVVYFSECQSM
jgi:hypothetical protein